MDEIYELTHRVGYFQVDRNHRIQLGSLFKLLQEAAIHHANQAKIGTQIMEDKGESWILNRVAMKLERYPKFDEVLLIKTWASGMKHFKGFRDFRLYVGDELIGQVSTLWLYINMESKSLTRLPQEIEDNFLTRPDEVYFDKLDKLRLPKPGADAQETRISLRYGDIDGNQHVNNTAYMKYLQTALHHQNLDTRPEKLEIQFAREISPAAQFVSVQLSNEKKAKVFGISSSGTIASFGYLHE